LKIGIRFRGASYFILVNNKRTHTSAGTGGLQCWIRIAGGSTCVRRGAWHYRYQVSCGGYEKILSSIMSTMLGRVKVGEKIFTVVQVWTLRARPGHGNLEKHEFDGIRARHWTLEGLGCSKRVENVINRKNTILYIEAIPKCFYKLKMFFFLNSEKIEEKIGKSKKFQISKKKMDFFEKSFFSAKKNLEQKHRFFFCSKIFWGQFFFG
jgi:hypothetical protein